MDYKEFIFALLLVLFRIGGMNAQIVHSEMNELISSREFLEENNLNRNLVIQQISSVISRFLVVKQELNFSNKAIINQIGNNHITSLSQTGKGNEANLFSTGNFIKLEVNQTGNNNSIFSNLSNNTLQLYSALLEQTGNSNTIELTLLSNNEIPGLERVVSVTQTGNDLNFSFSKTYDSPDLPISIEQKSGVNGQGMDVNVTTSAFYFPLN